ncbi:MAG: hypothetical protein KDD33_12280 [Bdellovibrionales bacterium]|nr:hypothetical protein [Bdellovibrionales bacterium]
MRFSYLVTFALGLLLTLVNSCDEGAPEENFGPETTAEAIYKSQVESLLKLDPFAVKKGQSVHHLETQEIVTSAGPIKNIVKESTFEVLDYEELDISDVITALEKYIDYREEDQYTYEIKHVYYLGKKATEVSSKANIQAFEAKLAPKSLVPLDGEIDEEQILDVTFHNLKKTQVVMVPPEKVLKDGRCRDLSPCEIKADLLTYDVVFHLDDGSSQSHQLEWYFSHQVPFFAGVLKQCATTLVPSNDLRVLVKQCREVIDFQF